MNECFVHLELLEFQIWLFKPGVWWFDPAVVSLIHSTWWNNHGIHCYFPRKIRCGFSVPTFWLLSYVLLTYNKSCFVAVLPKIPSLLSAPLRSIHDVRNCSHLATVVAIMDSLHSALHLVVAKNFRTHRHKIRVSISLFQLVLIAVLPKHNGSTLLKISPGPHGHKETWICPVWNLLKESYVAAFCCLFHIFGVSVMQDLQWWCVSVNFQQILFIHFLSFILF